ncbi:MAG: helicase-related protein [Gemmatimonadaceae bacterium]
MRAGGATGASKLRILAGTSAEVRDAIARCVLTDEEAAGIPERLGPIRLRPHQLDAAARLRRLLAQTGGALLADEVGLGKTYVALALARDATRPLVVSPAVLLPMWRSALERVGCRATLLSFERLSRAGTRATQGMPADPDLVIVDEAHHVRTPTTRRYAALAALCVRSPVLLLSATPLHNSRRDLAAQLALFLGAEARAMSDAELARHVVRRTRDDVRIDQSPPPSVAAPVWVEIPTVDDCLDALLALPPPLPASDGGDGGALLVYSLVRQWASSRAALRAALRRRLARATGLMAALESGRHPSRAELSAWSYAEDAVQLAFAELVAGPSTASSAAGAQPDAIVLLAAVRAHEAAVRALLRILDATADPDVARGAAIRAIRERHPAERIVAFAESAETVEAMFRQLRPDGGVAMLRARGATVSGGSLSRAEVLARFAPIAQGAREPHASQRVDMLLATDLLSEGVNLQDASVVVHLDLPWNPARLEQRVGRVSRLGSRHATVSVYAMRPPAAAERLLAVERRLRAKLAEAGRSVGVVGAILPGLGATTPAARGAAGEWSRVIAILHDWRAPRPRPDTRQRAPPHGGGNAVVQVAAVSSPTGGFIAALCGGEGPLLLASLRGTEPTAAPSGVLAALELAGGAELPVDHRSLAAAIEAVDRWLGGRVAADVSGVERGAVARSRRGVLARIARVASRAPRHLRSVIGPLAEEARRAALMPLGEGAERVLAELAEAPLADQAWLTALRAFAELHRRSPDAPPGREASTPELVALLLLDPARQSHA